MTANDPLSFEDRDSVAYRAGRASRYIGQPFEANPYEESSPRRALWSHGWNDQDADPDQISDFNRAGYRPNSYKSLEG